MIQASQIAAATGRPTVVGMDRQARDPSGEAAALSAAIQRLISERDRHKGLVAVQEEELIRLRAINEELRHQNEELALARAGEDRKGFAPLQRRGLSGARRTHSRPFPDRHIESGVTLAALF